MLTRIRRRLKGGFTLIELMVVVAIIGILAAVAIPAFMKNARKAKTTEAVTNVKKIYEGARSYYEEEANSRHSTTPLPKQFPNGSQGATPAANSCCGSQNGDKCDPSLDRTIWSTPIWNALKFSMDDPHYYWYQYSGSGTGTASHFSATAHGNLDCDTVYSTFEMDAVIDAADRSVRGMAGMYRNNEIE